MQKEPIKVRLHNERHFIRVYKDFFRCDKLTPTEKLVFIGLKDFLDYRDDAGNVFPSLETLANNIGLNIKTVIKTIKSLEKKGVVQKERRGLTKSNIYTLKDEAGVWKASTVEDMIELAKSEITLSTDEMIAELKRRGVIVDDSSESIIKEPLSKAVTEDNDSTKNTNIIVKKNNNAEITNSQAIIDEIKVQIDYNTLIAEQDINDLEAIISIMSDVYTTDEDYININKTNKKPSNMVKSKFQELDYYDILSVLKAYEQEQRKGTQISNHEAYLKTMLYKAKWQNSQKLNNIGRNNNDF